MRFSRLAFLALFLSGAALAQFSGSPVHGSKPLGPNSNVTVKTVTASTSVQTPDIKGAGGQDRILLPSGGTTTLTSAQAPTGSAVGTVIDTAQTYGAGDTPLQIKTGGGAIFNVSAGGTVSAGSGVFQPLGTNNTNMHGNVVNGASAIAVKVTNSNALSTTGAKMLDVYSDNGSTEQAYLIKDANGWNWRVEGKPVPVWNDVNAAPKTMLAGTATLSGGVVAISFSTAFAATPVCTATDQTATAAVQVALSSTGITFHGTGSDVLTWICIGNR